MKTIALIFTLSLTQIAIATSAEDVKKKAAETADAAADYTKEQKAAFVKDMEENIAGLKAQIKTMKEKADHSTAASVQKLEAQQEQLEKDLDQMKKSSGNAWKKLKSGVAKAWSEIKTSMSEAKEELKK